MACSAAPFALASDQELSSFLKHVERRAFKRTVFAVRDDDAALDIVQDAMIRLAQRYADRPAEELPLLFQRILSNATMDWFRRQKVRQGLISNLGDIDSGDESTEFDLLERLESADSAATSESAADAVSRAQVLLEIEKELELLPARQQIGRAHV